MIPKRKKAKKPQFPSPNDQWDLARRCYIGHRDLVIGHSTLGNGMLKRTGLIALLTLGCLPLVALAAPASSVGNLGDSLLDDDLAKALSPEAPAKPAGPGAFVPKDEMLDRLLKQGGMEAAGEDVGESPLAGVVNGMRQAESLIRNETKAKPAVPVQKEVVTRLEQLIAQMEKQCQGGSCNKPQSDKEKQASKRSQPKPSEGQCDKPGEAKKPGQASKKLAQKANQSGTSGANAGVADVDPAQQQELLKAAWGHLPERMRERMLQGSDSEFLPEYRDELQQYYRRLAERSSQEAP
jgi:hypothetical protein